MAKRIASEVEEQEGVIIPAETPVEKEEIQKEEKAAPAAQVKAAVKKVRFHCIEEVDCIIAGVAYNFPKGKEVDVPADVAAILNNSQRAYRM